MAAIPAATASAAEDSLAPAPTSLNETSAAPTPSVLIAASSGPTGSTHISTPVEPTPTSTTVEFTMTPVEPTPTSTTVELTMNPATPSEESVVMGGGISAIVALRAEAENAEAVKSPHTVIPTQSPSKDDIDMRPATAGVAPSPNHKKDDNLPPWLALMIDYLRGVSEDAAWQDLVTEFVDFEKHYPPNGVSLSVSFVFSLNLTILL